MVLMIPVNAALATWSRKLQVKQMALKDSRIKLVNELLNGIKVLCLSWDMHSILYIHNYTCSALIVNTVFLLKIWHGNNNIT